MPTLLAETYPRSRGKVRCDLCGHPIPAGVVYTQQSLTDDGRVYTWRECPVCEDAATGFMEANPSDWWVDGYDTDTIDEWARDNPDDERAVAYLARRSAGSTPDTGSTA